jgi:hypothetical protein
MRVSNVKQSWESLDAPTRILLYIAIVVTIAYATHLIEVNV